MSDFVIEHRDPSLLAKHPLNFRRHPPPQVAALSASIEEHGWLAAPIWNKRSGNLLDGHARVELALERNEATIPVRVIDVPVAQEKRILRAFDRIGAMAEVDDGSLARLIEEIGDTDLERLLGEFTEPESGLLAGADPDAIPEVVDTRCKAGDLWLLGEHRLLCGDSTKAEDVERLMGGKRAPLMATDPPYLVDYHGGNHPSSNYNDPVTKDKWWDDYQEGDSPDFYHRFIAVALKHALTSKPAIYQWHAHKRQTLVESAWVENGLLVHQQIIWHKARPVLAHSHFMWAHEPCFYGWRQGSIPEMIPPNNERTVWQVDAQGNSNELHPTQKPVGLFLGPIEWHTRPSEICYEPFLGSGTQMVAAEQVGRACYGIEISAEFCDVILARWEQATGRDARLAD